MNWMKTLLIGTGATLFLGMVERNKTNALIEEAKQARFATRKPILFISTTENKDFDVWMDPTKIDTQRLPYPDKRFAAVVSDSLECVLNPQAALTEWQRVADGVLVNTSPVISPMTWLNLKHNYVFSGDKILRVHPGVNWGIAGGLGYYAYNRSKPKSKRKALPLPENIEGTDDNDENVEMAPKPEEMDDNLPLETEDDQFEDLHPIEESDLDGLGTEPAALPEPDESLALAEPETNILHDKVKWRRGTTNLDIGGGLGDAPEGVENLTFAPGILPEEVNRQIIAGLETSPADTATLADVLQEIPEADERLGALQV
ncbi:MAG: hypothetical protein ACYS1A_19505, partial [Planctomycetota bacterium]